MSQAVVCNGVAYLAGQIAVDQAGAPVSEQTREILDRTDALLAALGTDKSRILSAAIYLADIASFEQMNAVWDAWVAPGATPARATIEARLALPVYSIEISFVVAVGVAPNLPSSRKRR